MMIHRLIAAMTLPTLLVFALPAGAVGHAVTIAQAAKPTPDQVKAAVKNALASVNLTMRQKREIKSMVETYKAQTATADDATKQTAAKTLLKNIYNTLTPEQQPQFKASIKQSLGMDMQSSGE